MERLDRRLERLGAARILNQVIRSLSARLGGGLGRNDGPNLCLGKPAARAHPCDLLGFAAFHHYHSIQKRIFTAF